jgi:hypothetical protein
MDGNACRKKLMKGKQRKEGLIEENNEYTKDVYKLETDRRRLKEE